MANKSTGILFMVIGILVLIIFIWWNFFYPVPFGFRILPPRDYIECEQAGGKVTDYTQCEYKGKIYKIYMQLQ